MPGPRCLQGGSQPVPQPHPPEQPGLEAGSQLTVCGPCPEEEGRRRGEEAGEWVLSLHPWVFVGSCSGPAAGHPVVAQVGQEETRPQPRPVRLLPMPPSLPLPILCSPEIRTAQADSRQQPCSALPSGPPALPEHRVSLGQSRPRLLHGALRASEGRVGVTWPLPWCRGRAQVAGTGHRAECSWPSASAGLPPGCCGLGFVGPWAGRSPR